MVETKQVLDFLKELSEVQVEISKIVAVAEPLKQESDVLLLMHFKAMSENDMDSIDRIQSRLKSIEGIFKEIVLKKEKLMSRMKDLESSDLHQKIEGELKFMEKYKFNKN